MVGPFFPRPASPLRARRRHYGDVSSGSPTLHQPEAYGDIDAFDLTVASSKAGFTVSQVLRLSFDAHLRLFPIEAEISSRIFVDTQWDILFDGEAANEITLRLGVPNVSTSV